jgi:hypothetical protein
MLSPLDIRVKNANLALLLKGVLDQYRLFRLLVNAPVLPSRNAPTLGRPKLSKASTWLPMPPRFGVSSSAHSSSLGTWYPSGHGSCSDPVAQSVSSCGDSQSNGATVAVTKSITTGMGHVGATLIGPATTSANLVPEVELVHSMLAAPSSPLPHWKRHPNAEKSSMVAAFRNAPRFRSIHVRPVTGDTMSIITVVGSSQPHIASTGAAVGGSVGAAVGGSEGAAVVDGALGPSAGAWVGKKEGSDVSVGTAEGATVGGALGMCGGDAVQL